MTRKTALSAFFLLVACIISRVSFASSVTLTLESTDNGIYPYAFEINHDNKTLYDLSCLNDQRHVSVGESWTATEVRLDTLISDPQDYKSGISVADLKEDAYLDSKYITDPSNPNYTVHNIEVQDAIWSVLDGNHVYTDISGPDSAAEKGEVDSFIVAAETTKEGSDFYSDFTYYYPQTWSDDRDPGQIPQQFLGYCPAVTPEPSSLVLLGTGIVGLAGVMRRRLMSSNQA